ncbi:phytanoyl-CoA dioxygenase family protein [Paucibacter sp. R3-3]|uniref:Phytanoyl-CoA dioxygenase family protein n=1 Tax=Roseateles agri TaxID=3098619 RepID=A0ABU5DNN3_9BURK|nr:phytanoyl-CoA dioxygenase family protein [Paucibacter sp. R3-3]MDY0747285.1 phytanoyl-CoA dioxygenase family protein [Paucibacter sp. R3-3]
MAHATDYDQDDHPTSTRSSTQLSQLKKRLPLRVLSPEDFAHWQRRGYVIVRNAVPAENVERLKSLLWEFEEKDPKDPSTWDVTTRREHPEAAVNYAGMVEIYNHQLLWDNRMQQRVYDAFVDIWDIEDLWVAIDRANLNTPNRGKRKSNGFIHWDADTSREPKPISVQGVLSLVHQDGGDIGGFQCVPWLFEHFDEWVKTQPADRDPHHPDMTGIEDKLEKLELFPGDLMIFNSLLAHGVAPNMTEDKVRMAQYISMFPAEEANTAEREARITSWRELEPPIRAGFPGDPRGWEKKHGRVAELTPLGEKLLGLKRW